MNALNLRVIETVKQRILKYRNLVLILINVAVLTPFAWGLETTQVINKAAQGDKSAAYFLGVMYRTGSGVSLDCNKSMKWTEQSASQGHALAQSHLGVMYRNGCGETVNKNLPEAYFWTSLATKQGLQFAKRNLKELEEQLHPYLIKDIQQKVENFKPTKLY